MRDLIRVLANVRPGANFRLDKSDPPHELIEWRGPGEEPTQAEIEQGWQNCLADGKQHKSLVMNQAVNAYILARYDVGAQVSFLSVFVAQYAAANIQNTSIQGVWNWIKSVLVYYYAKTEELAAITSMDALEAFGWDFETFTAPDPEIELKDLL